MEKTTDHKEYMRLYRQANRLKLNAGKKIQTAKKRIENKAKAISILGNCCSMCKGIFPNCVYDFHHLDETEKVKDPGALMHLSWDTVYEEVRKCILLCANCHRLIHYQKEQTSE